jgi:hypothetical protein
MNSDDDKAADQPTLVGAGNDETTIVPPPTEAAPELAWSAASDDFSADADQKGLTWRDRVRWAPVAAAVLLPVSAIVLLLVLLYDAHNSRTNDHAASSAPSVTTVSAQQPPSTVVVVPSAAPPAAAPPAATKPALPVAIEGSSCRPQSTPTVDPDGVTVYCALFPEIAETAFWSRTPGPVAWPTIGGVRVPDQAGSYPWVVVCEQQTGRTYNYCEAAIAQATYQGDGQIPES